MNMIPSFEYHHFLDYCEKYDEKRDMVLLHPPMAEDAPEPSFLVFFKDCSMPQISFGISEGHPQCQNSMHILWELRSNEVVLSSGNENARIAHSVTIDIPSGYNDIQLFVKLQHDRAVARAFCGVIITGLRRKNNPLRAKNNPGSSSCYASCISIESHLVFQYNHVAFCCMPTKSESNPIITYYKEDNTIDIEEYLRVREEARRTQPAACKGCPLYKLDNWSTGGKIININIAYAAPCNFKCEYCFTSKPGHKPLIDYPNIKPSLEQFYKMNMLAENCCFAFSAGEPAIYKYLDDVCEIARKVHGIIHINSNCSIYSTTIADMLRGERCTIQCSVDAGTRETFRMVKGVDAYSSVIENLSSYVRVARGNRDSRIISKYILYKRNNSAEEMTAYIKTMYEIGIKYINFTFNYEERFNEVSDSYIKNMALGVFLAEGLGMSIDFEGGSFADIMPSVKERIGVAIDRERNYYDDILQSVVSECVGVPQLLLSSIKLEPELAIGYIDRIANDISTDIRHRKADISVRRGTLFHFIGWIVDEIGKTVFESVYVAIDDAMYLVDSRVERPDIAETYGSPCLMAGFELSLPMPIIEMGEHTIRFIGVTADGKYYCAKDMLQIQVE